MELHIKADTLTINYSETLIMQAVFIDGESKGEGGVNTGALFIDEKSKGEEE